MSTPERAVVAPEVEAVAEASRGRFTMESTQSIVRGADGRKTHGAAGARLRREGLCSFLSTRAPIASVASVALIAPRANSTLYAIDAAHSSRDQPGSLTLSYPTTLPGRLLPRDTQNGAYSS